jgi:hypothetical protein
MIKTGINYLTAALYPHNIYYSMKFHCLRAWI